MRSKLSVLPLRRALLAAAFAAGIGIGATAIGAETLGTLSGAQEVPPVKTAASGRSGISVKSDMSVTGTIDTSGIAGTAAHIHSGASGTNGPVVVTLTKTADARWSVPPGTMLTAEQYKRYRAGDLYVNVHSDMYPNGEMRLQLKP